MRLFSMLVMALVAVGCGDSGSGEGGSTSGDKCSADEVEVDYLGGPEDGRADCKAIPSECGGVVNCADDTQECSAALYGLCEADYNGVGCSPLEGHASLISCNPPQ